MRNIISRKDEKTALFPFNWIFREIKYQYPNQAIPDEVPQIIISFKDIDYFNIYACAPILKNFSKIGADPNYIVAILMYHIDPSKYFTFKEITKNQLENGKKALKEINSLIQEIEEILEPDIIQPLKDALKKIKSEIKKIDVKGLISYTLHLPISKKPLKRKKGRPSKELINKIIILIFMHLKKRAIIEARTLGYYSRIANLLNTFLVKENEKSEERVKLFDKKDINKIVKKYQYDKKMTKYCKDFENEYENITENLIARAKKLGILRQFVKRRKK